jgi:hypothetical protein
VIGAPAGELLQLVASSRSAVGIRNPDDGVTFGPNAQAANPRHTTDWLQDD